MADEKKRIKEPPFPCPVNGACLLQPWYSYDTKRKQHRLILRLSDKRISKKYVCHYSSNLSELKKDAKGKYAIELYNLLEPDEINHFKIMDNNLEKLSLRTVFDTQKKKLEELLGKRRQAKIDVLEELCANLSQVSIDKLKISDCYEAIGTVISNKNPATDEEISKLNNTCVALLKLMFDFCLSSGFCTKHPGKYLSVEDSQIRVIIEHMRAKSLSHAEEARLFNFLVARCKTDPRALGALLCLLLGLSLSEVCALCFSDILRLDGVTELNQESLFSNGPYVLKISRVYRCFDGEYIMSDLVESRYVYRKLPLTDICLHYIRQRYLYVQQALNFNNIDKLPIICSFNSSANNPDGMDSDNSNFKKHYRPDYLKKYIRHLLEDLEIKQADLLIPPPEKGSTEIREIRMKSRVNRLRQHFEHRLRYCCGMERGEVSYLLGLKPNDVDSLHYIDFMDRMMLTKLRQKLERWKPVLIQNEAGADELLPRNGVVRISGSEWSSCIRPNTNRDFSAFYVELTVEPGASVELDLSCYTAFNGTISIEEEVVDDAE